MPEYNILRWDPVMLDKNTFPYPMFYIVPDEAFTRYANENNNIVSVTISNTNSQYDGKPVIGIVNMSSNFPNKRPNFFNATQSIVVSLMTNWIGYPNALGTASFRGMKGADKLQAPKHIPFQAPKPIEEMYTSDTKEPCKGTLNIFWVTFTFIMLLLFFAIFNIQKNIE